jgi:hypothetical protein
VYSYLKLVINVIVIIYYRQEKEFLVKEKKQKETEKKETTRTCSDCNGVTDNFYCISTNRGTIFKCNSCYELWCIRETRAAVSHRTNQGVEGDTLI